MSTCAVDHEQLAVDFIRALRGSRSQRAFSQRLGYRTNIAYRWESKRCFPTAAATFAAMHRLRVDVRQAVIRFYRNPTPWVLGGKRPPLTTPDSVAFFLNEQRGKTPIVALAQRSGHSRYQITRWLHGTCQPRLPDFFALLEAASLRLADFASAFFDPSELPSIAPTFERLEALRNAAYDDPWCLAVLRVLELDRYRSQRRPPGGFIAKELGIDLAQEARSLELLEKAGCIAERGGRYEVMDTSVLDTRRDPERARALKRFWLDVAGNRLEQQSPGTFAYNVFSLSSADYNRVVALHREFFREVQEVVAASTPGEKVALLCTQLLPLSTNE